MSHNSKLTRRKFCLDLTVTASLAFLFPWQTLLGGSYADMPMRSVDTLTGIIPNQESAAIIGREYLRIKPDEADVQKLVQLLNVRRDLTQDHQVQVDKSVLRTVLKKRQSDDFKCGRTVRIQGWVLSETECRLFALSALA